MQYAIAQNDWQTARKKLDRIMRKSERHGGSCTYRVIGNDVRKIDDVHGVRVVLVEVDGKLENDDWSVVAQLDCRENGNVVRMIDTSVTIPERYRTSPNVCDHCGQRRARKNLYVVRNRNTGEYKQVGSTCLMEYTGIDPQIIAAYYDAVATCEQMEDSFNDMSFSQIQIVVPTEKAVEAAVRVFRSMGYVKSSESNLCNRDILRELIFYGTEDCIRMQGVNLRESEDSDAVVARNIIDAWRSYAPTNDFEHNCKTLCMEDYLTCRDMGLVAYLPVWWQKCVESKRKIESKEHSNISEYFGEVGKRYKNVRIDSICLATSWDGCYDGYTTTTTYLYRIIAQGDVFVWKTQKVFAEDEVTAISFTVKAHKEWRGVKQTEITRCRLEN